MAGPWFDAIEREQLADLFDELGAGAPTLLEPWTTRDLVSHLALREHDSLAAQGLVVPGAWTRFAERRRRALAGQEFPWLVATSSLRGERHTARPNTSGPSRLDPVHVQPI